MLRKETAEKYLKVILSLTQRNRPVRACEIAEKMHVSRPTVCVTLRELEEAGYLEYTGERVVVLTALGAEVAGNVAERFRFFRSLLMQVGVSPQTAERDAVLLERSLSGESYERIRAFYEKQNGGSPQ